MAFPGNGFLIANDLLTEISYILVEPVVNTQLGTAVMPGVQTVTPPSLASIYVGAMLIVGSGTDEEVITVTAVASPSFTATFANSHPSTDPLYGATFPVGEDNNPFFSQPEVLSYVSNAQNDYLVRVPMIEAVTTQNFAPTQRTQNVPSDAIQIERVAVGGYPLLEQGQSSLDQIWYLWPTTTPGPPRTWFEDRLNFMTYGVQPVPLNAFTVEVIYAQRDSQQLALNEGFLLPDPFLHYVKYGALAAIFSKDGEQRDPARAQYCMQRFMLGVRIGMHFYDNSKMQGVVNG